MLIPITKEHFSQGALSFQAAVRAAYEKDLDWIESMLCSGLSVRVVAEKSLSLLLYTEIRVRLKSRQNPQKCVLIQSPPSAQGRSFMHAMVESLWERVQEQLGEENSVVVMPHLDLLATTTESNLGGPAREAIAAMSQDPGVTLLAFCDPALRLPQAIEDLFDVQRELVGIPRSVLPHLISYEEAQRFGVDQLNLFRLYKYVSGLNAVKLRKVMTRLTEFPPLISLPVEEREQERIRIERTLREMTLLGGMEIPEVDLEDDIGGYDEVKKKIREEILEILSLREEPEWADQGQLLESTLPRGLLFYGPPGTGKTYFAKAIASALNATTTVISGPEIKSKWVGESEANLRRIFAQARTAAPSLIIFDEIDAIAPRRGMYQGAGVNHSLVNQLLTEMDGFRNDEMVFVVGTTNFPQSVDPALLRPGRFEYHLHVPYPNRKAREEIAKIYAKKFNFSMSEEVFEHLVERTGMYVDATRNVRYSGDHLYGIARQLKRLQARRRDLSDPFPVTKADIDEVMGPNPYQVKGWKEKRRRKAAYHEAGHAVVAALLLGPRAVQKATVEADNPDVEGMVSLHSYVTEGATRAVLLHMIQVALAGRAAEEQIYQELDIGAKNDLDYATDLARKMVEELGMSEQFGPRVYRTGENPEVQMGGMTRELIDKEVNDLLKEQYKATQTLLFKHADDLENLTQALLKEGELESQAIAEVLGLEWPDEEEPKERAAAVQGQVTQEVVRLA